MSSCSPHHHYYFYSLLLLLILFRTCVVAIGATVSAAFSGCNSVWYPQYLSYDDTVVDSDEQLVSIQTPIPRGR